MSKILEKVDPKIATQVANLAGINIEPVVMERIFGVIELAAVKGKGVSLEDVEKLNEDFLASQQPPAPQPMQKKK